MIRNQEFFYSSRKKLCDNDNEGDIVSGIMHMIGEGKYVHMNSYLTPQRIYDNIIYIVTY
jgi:hypothetical protein